MPAIISEVTKKSIAEELCFENTGTSDVIVYLRKEKARKRLDASFRTDASEGVLEKLCEKRECNDGGV